MSPAPINRLRLFGDLLSIFGLNTSTPDRTLRTHWQWKLWSVLILLFQLGVVFITLFFRDFFLRSELSAVGMLFNLIHYSWMMCTSCFVIAKSLLSERLQPEYWTRLQRLHELRFQEEPIDNKFYRKLARNAFGISISLIVVYVSVFYFIAYDPQWTVYMLVGLTSLMINRMFCVKVFVFLEGLRCELEAFERFLTVFSEEKEMKDIHLVLSLDWHAELVAIAEMFLRIFEGGLFLIFADGFILMGVNFYWAYIHMFCEKRVLSSMSEWVVISWCIINLIHLIAALVMVTTLMLIALFLVLDSSEKVTNVYKRCVRLSGLLQGKGNTDDVRAKAWMNVVDYVILGVIIILYCCR